MGTSVDFESLFTVTNSLVYPVATFGTSLFLYGLYIALVGTALHLLWTRPGSNKKLFTAWVISLFALATCGVIANLVIVFNQSAKKFTALQTRDIEPYRDYTRHDTIKTVGGTLAHVFYVVANCVADSVLIYRCYVIWGSRKRFMIFPVFASFIINAMGFVSSVIDGKATSDTSIPSNWDLLLKNEKFLFAYYCANAAFNAVLTLLIASRIWWVTRAARKLMGSETSKRYKSIIAVLLESGILYAIAVILEVAIANSATTIGSPINLMTIITQMAGIAPTLIIVRTRIGRATETAQDVVSTMRFTMGQPVEGQSTSVSRGTLHSSDVDMKSVTGTQKNELALE